MIYKQIKVVKKQGKTQGIFLIKNALIFQLVVYTIINLDKSRETYKNISIYFNRV
jgi:hypothetical protein